MWTPLLCPLSRSLAGSLDLKMQSAAVIKNERWKEEDWRHDNGKMGGGKEK